MRRRLFVLLMIVLPCSLSLAVQVGAATQDPTDQLRPLIDKVTDILTDSSSAHHSNEEKVDRVMEIARDGFDFEEMSKRVLGSRWRSLSAQEKSKFVDTFTELLKYAYVRQIDRYSGQRIEFLDQRIRGKRAEVKTLFLDGDTQIPVSYILIDREGKWLIYDVVVEGVSLIRNYLEQFQEILRKEDFQGLIVKLEAKITELKNSPTQES
ncbi:MlaC/ttg2D family ABC transporter substrate-binding protein [Desulfogranum japonicum]|uniref:MlaC/ttg2D family ABC transporter substrate-binding protein n=1 Tax=Desulfogranum japonicum TaxID=231447 RepID=UPI00041D4F20|nr:ABC transporter substrate-binding protein [Desulfogranum japonicum]